MMTRYQPRKRGHANELLYKGGFCYRGDAAGQPQRCVS
jgi:hypothetical protein